MSDRILLENAQRAAEILISDIQSYAKTKILKDFESMRVVGIGEFANATHYPQMTSMSKLELMIQAPIGKENIAFCFCLKDLLSRDGHPYSNGPFAVNIRKKNERAAKWIYVDLVSSECGPFLPSAAASIRDVDPENVPIASIADMIGLKLYYWPPESLPEPTRFKPHQPSREEVEEAENMVNDHRPVFLTPRVKQAIDSGLAYAQQYSHHDLAWWEQSFFVEPMVDGDSFTKPIIWPRYRAHPHRMRSVSEAGKPLDIDMHQGVPDTADVGAGRLRSAAASSNVPHNNPNTLATDTRATTRPTLAHSIGRHLLLCISTRTGDTLRQIDMSPIQNDEELFRCINQQYLEVKKAETGLPPFFFRRLCWSLHRPNEMNYISFQPLHLCDAVYPTHIRSPSLPPESEVQSKRWEYSPSPRDPEGWTIPGYLLPRVLQHGPSTRGSTWIGTMPQRLGDKLGSDEDPQDEVIVWGVQIKDGFNITGIHWLLSWAFIAGALIASVLIVSAFAFMIYPKEDSGTTYTILGRKITVH